MQNLAQFCVIACVHRDCPETDACSVWKYLNPVRSTMSARLTEQDKELPTPASSSAGCAPTAHVSMMLASMSSLGAFATTCLPAAQTSVKSIVSATPISSIGGGGDQRRRGLAAQATACAH